MHRHQHPQLRLYLNPPKAGEIMAKYLYTAIIILHPFGVQVGLQEASGNLTLGLPKAPYIPSCWAAITKPGCAQNDDDRS